MPDLALSIKDLSPLCLPLLLSLPYAVFGFFPVAAAADVF